MKTTLRILSLTLALLALTLCFAACGDKGGSDSKLVFVTPNNVTLAVGAPAADAVTTLGDWVSMNSSDSCGGFSGKDYLYTYHGFRMSTTPAKDGQIICKVELTDDAKADLARIQALYEEMHLVGKHPEMYITH